MYVRKGRLGERASVWLRGKRCVDRVRERKSTPRTSLGRRGVGEEKDKTGEIKGGKVSCVVTNTMRGKATREGGRGAVWCHSWVEGCVWGERRKVS